jgi:hypothetical protein
MATKAPAQASPIVPAEIWELLGPPPVLSTEDTNKYEKALLGFAQCVRPKDFIEWMWVRDLADERLEIQRQRVFKIRLVEEAHKAKLTRTTAVTEARLVSEVWGLCVTARSVLSPNPLKTKLKAEREKKLQADIDKLVAESEKKLALLNKLPTDADYASALKDWIVFYEQADKLQSTAQKRFDAILEQLDRHREGLGRRLRQVSDDIIDGEFEEAPGHLQEDEVAPAPRSKAIIDPPVTSPSTAREPSAPIEPVTSPMETPVPAPSTDSTMPVHKPDAVGESSAAGRERMLPSIAVAVPPRTRSRLVGPP